ncbi:MAG: N-acetylmuramoyl-L-alanine amidase [Pseudomonadota bacterium]|nr:N-acetylmuramoyl-L-alanine amidase [Pseudomonadota bacterium]
MPDTRLPCALHAAANHEPRRHGGPVDMLVLHYTGMRSGEAALDRLCAADSGVSCHYLVFEDGRIVQMVAESERAWHAGKAIWRGVTDINSRSIGIEIVNPGHENGYRPFAEAQMAAVTALSRDIVERHGIAPRDTVAHSDIAPERKADPGEFFDWQRLYEAGAGLWVEPAAMDEGEAANAVLGPGDEGAAVAGLQRMLAEYGYGIDATGRYDAPTVAVVTAFQRHYRQGRVDGLADSSTRATLARLLAALAV